MQYLKLCIGRKNGDALWSVAVRLWCKSREVTEQEAPTNGIREPENEDG